MGGPVSTAALLSTGAIGGGPPFTHAATAIAGFTTPSVGVRVPGSLRTSVH